MAPAPGSGEDPPVTPVHLLQPPSGCGCAALPPDLMLAFAAWLGLRRRRTPTRSSMSLDLSRLLPGPMAGVLYLRANNLGTEVVKVENPQVGDYLRYSPPFDAQGRSIWFTTINHRRRSLALDSRSAPPGPPHRHAEHDGRAARGHSPRRDGAPGPSIQKPCAQVYPHLIIASISGKVGNAARRRHVRRS